MKECSNCAWPRALMMAIKSEPCISCDPDIASKWEPGEKISKTGEGVSVYFDQKEDVDDPGKSF